jgi:thiamine monophosphate kinase
VLAVAAAEAARRGESAWSFAARSGEEYELLAALPPDVTDADLADAPAALTVVGWVEAEPGVRATAHGAPAALPAGWDHFGRG